MATIEANSSHVEDALNRLLEQFKGKVKVADLISALVQPIQDLDTTLLQLYTNRWIDSAEGAALDNLGEIVQQPRQGRTDEEYRPWIKARIIVNRTNGQGDDTLRVAELVIGSLAEVELIEQWPAAYVVRSYSLDEVAQDIFDILRLVKPAGVDFFFEYSTRPATQLFKFASGPAFETSVTQGFGNGHFASVIATE